MKKVLLFVLITLASFTNAFSQEKRDYVWLTGYEGLLGIDPEFGLTVYDFNSEPVNIYKAAIEGLSFGSNSSSISSKTGELLFYTGGCFVYGKNNMLIENGDIINEGQFRDRCTTGNGYISGNASTIFLPDPAHESEFYLIHQRVEELSPSRSILLYSKIDAAGNNGLGAVTEANIVISPDSVLLGEMAAAKHANGVDWWVAVPEDESNVYNIILIDKTGIRKSHDQKIGLPIDYEGMGTGQCKFSPDGKKFARWTSTKQLLIADFDRATGTFSNNKQITVLDEGTRGGTEFSPNSKLLYITTSDSIFQFDTEESNIEDSKVLVAEWDGFSDFLPTKFRRMQLSPDCRIFISLPGGHRYWHVIENPNEKGLACNVVQRGISLKTWTFNTMPYFPNYNLGPVGNEGYPCDSTKITVSSSYIPIIEPLGFVYPNPTQGQLRVDLPTQAEQVGFRLFSSTGQLVFSKKELLAREEMDLGGVARGIYFYKIFDKKGRVWSGKVIIEN